MYVSNLSIEDQVYNIRKATTDDLPYIKSLLIEAAKWIQSQGLKQWGYYVTDFEGNVQEIVDSIHNEATYIVEDGRSVIATVTIEGKPNEWDFEIWGEEATDSNVVYLHRLAIDRRYAGQKIGESILHWAMRHAKDEGMSYLRLDCVGKNEKLNNFYQQHLPLKEVVELYGGQSKYEKKL